MSATEKHVDDAAKEKMADLLQEEAKFMTWDAVHYYRHEAMLIVETFIKAGWTPPNE